jgi:hypothetical protein
MVDTPDSKSCECKLVRVQVPPRPPSKNLSSWEVFAMLKQYDELPYAYPATLVVENRYIDRPWLIRK